MKALITFSILFVLIACGNSGSKSNSQSFTATARYCPDGYCVDGTFVSHWKLDNGEWVWIGEGKKGVPE